MPHSLSIDAIFQGMPYIAMCSGWLLGFYLLKRHENWILSFLKLCTLIDFTFADQGVTIALFTYICLVINCVDLKTEWWGDRIVESQNPFSGHIGINIAQSSV